MIYNVQTYDQLIRQSYVFDEKTYLASEDHAVLRTLYENNYLNNDSPAAHKIPHKIHQIWLGGEIPKQFRRWGDSWKKFHPNWEYRLWTDKDIEEFNLTNKYFYSKAHNHGQRSDIFRHEILYRLGGIYVDTDFECLKPLDDFMHLDFFTSSGYSASVELYPALVGSIPGHPILGRYIKDMKYIEAATWKGMFESTGPYYFTQCFLKEVTKETKGVVTFPPKFFYPWPNHARVDIDPYSYVKSYSYAIHHWAVAWAKGLSRHKEIYGLDTR